MRGRTITSDCCDVANCDDASATMGEKGEIIKKGRTHCVAKELNDVSYKNNTHTPVISIYYFLKDESVWPKWTRFYRRHRGGFLTQSRRPGRAMPRPLRRRLLQMHAIDQIRGGWPMNSAKKKAD